MAPTVFQPTRRNANSSAPSPQATEPRVAHHDSVRLGRERDNSTSPKARRPLPLSQLSCGVLVDAAARLHLHPQAARLSSSQAKAVNRIHTGVCVEDPENEPALLPAD